MITVDRGVNLISTPNLSSKIVEVFTRISKATEAFISIYFKNVELRILGIKKFLNDLISF